MKQAVCSELMMKEEISGEASSSVCNISLGLDNVLSNVYYYVHVIAEEA
jgi:hypothetical protein